MPLFPLGICRRRDVFCMNGYIPVDPNDLSWREAGELACAMIRSPAGGLPPLQHAAAVEAIHRRVDVLPMRLGMVLREASEIDLLLLARARDFLDRLDDLEGACEMSLHIAPPFRPSDERHHSYHRLDAAEPWAGPVEQRLLDAVQNTYREYRWLPAMPNSLRPAFLIPRDGVAAFRHGLTRFGAGRPAAHCSTLGPRPPYSFVERAPLVGAAIL